MTRPDSRSAGSDAERPTSLLRRLTDEAELGAAIAESWLHPVVLFKHSPTCGISAMAFEELGTLAAEPERVPVYLIDVRSARDTSNTVARRFSLRHESPQVLLLARGQLRWSGSHFRVTADRVRQAFCEASIVE